VCVCVVDDVVAVALAEHGRLARPPHATAAHRVLVRLALGELRRVVDDRQRDDDGRRHPGSSKTTHIVTRPRSSVVPCTVLRPLRSAEGPSEPRRRRSRR